MSDWDWRVRSYQGSEFMLETVHKGETSLEMELAAIKRLGRRAEIFPLSDWALRRWREGYKAEKVTDD